MGRHSSSRKRTRTRRVKRYKLKQRAGGSTSKKHPLPKFILDHKGVPYPRIPVSLMETIDSFESKHTFKGIYNEPTKHDVAVLLCFFNPANFKRPLQNILLVLKTLRAAKIPTYVIECLFEGQEAKIPDSTMVVRSKTPMFYKEQLLNILEAKVPAQYTKLVLLDGDVLFDAPDWIDQISVALNGYTAVQPFERGARLMADNRTIRSFSFNFSWAYINRIPIRGKHGVYTPGYAWAVRRDFFKRIGGLFDKKIIGAGDISFALLFIKNLTDAEMNNVTGQNSVLSYYKEYYQNAQKLNPSLAYLNIGLYHLFHGLKKDRKYMDRYNKIQHILNTGWDSYMTRNADNLYEVTNAELKEYLSNYFKSRDEDISYEESMNPSIQSDLAQPSTQQKTQPASSQLIQAPNHVDPSQRSVSITPLIQRRENLSLM